MNSRRLNHPHDRMSLSEFLDKARLSRPTYYRRYSKDSDFLEAVGFGFDPTLDANSLDREKALQWIDNHLNAWRSQLSPHSSSRRTRALYKPCRHCGAMNHVRRSVCESCSANDWK